MESKKYKLVFLYTELATYFLSCLEKLIESGTVEVHLFRWPLNKEAPFDFKFHPEIKVYERKKYKSSELLKIMENIQPDLIYCSGWLDRGYKKVAKNYKKKIPVIVGIDNQWVGDFKQKIASFLSPFLVKKYFNKVWVPGDSQKLFAQKLGYKDKDILTGFYSADTDFFNEYFNRFQEIKKTKFPKRFIFVGRYLSFKGIYEMWDSFIELQTELPNDWELWCLGTGAEYEKRFEHEKIKHFGFVQPEEIQNFIRDTGVFILPSTFEPWGVVIHEFAASGFPIITTDKVGSASQFVKNGENGFIVEAGNKFKLKEAMKKMMDSSSEKLIEMSEASHLLAQNITPTKWAKQILDLLN
jgi:glycosyltransferase involved in cell wall biosynthesis